MKGHTQRQAAAEDHHQQHRSTMHNPISRERGREPQALRIRLLGGFEVMVGARIIEEGAWRLRKAANLIKLLALASGNRLHREQLMYTLWPNLGISAASNNLRQTAHAARRILDPAMGSRYLASREESLVLCPESSLWVDVEAFEQAARSARRSREPALYRAALELYSGELLPTDRYEEWAEGPRGRLKESYLWLVVGLAKLHEERADYASAIEALRQVVSEEPTSEEGHVGLMRLYALVGNNKEALAQYRRLEETLSRELGTEPAPSSRALGEEIAAGRFPPKEGQSLTSPPDGQPEAAKHNLPAPRSSFVGRETELLSVKRDLSMTRTQAFLLGVHAGRPRPGAGGQRGRPQAGEGGAILGYWRPAKHRSRPPTHAGTTAFLEMGEPFRARSPQHSVSTKRLAPCASQPGDHPL